VNETQAVHILSAYVSRRKSHPFLTSALNTEYCGCSEVLSLVSVTSNMISNVIPYSLVDSHQCVGGMCYVILQGLRARLGIDARVDSGNTIDLNFVIRYVSVYQIIWHHIL